MDDERDTELLEEILDALEEDEYDRIPALTDTADREGCINAAILGRMATTIDLREMNNVAAKVGLMAEVQRLWRENAHLVRPDVIGLVLTQMDFVLTILLCQPVPVDNIAELTERFEDLCRQQGSSLRSAYRLRMRIATRRGDEPAALRYLALSDAEPREELFVDMPWEYIDVQTSFGNDEGAVRTYRRELSRDEPPLLPVHQTAMLPLLRLSLVDEAERVHQLSLVEAEKDNDYAASLGPSLIYLAAVGRFDEGLELLELGLRDDPENPPTPLDMGGFAGDVSIFLAHLAAAGRGEERPQMLEGRSVIEAAAHFRQQAEEIISRFDALAGSEFGLTCLRRCFAMHDPRPGAPAGVPQ